ncbi:hypothetical protein [Methanoculleus sp.]|uniref:hypothetical protein n=1 Tax=Methanoculleus sp. TaxID=90427 RepID=UPI002629C719|nr:hypothetical protein [Methanoculleus sp.]MDD2255327.1 hypothetical protein [Methanoculleus sp.]
MKFYRIFRTSECEGQVETDAQLTVNGGVVADLTGDVTGNVTGTIGGVTIISGEGVPSDLGSAVNTLYFDITGHDLYVCTIAYVEEVSAETWKKFTRAE